MRVAQTPVGSICICEPAWGAPFPWAWDGHDLTPAPPRLRNLQPPADRLMVLRPGKEPWTPVPEAPFRRAHDARVWTCSWPGAPCLAEEQLPTQAAPEGPVSKEAGAAPLEGLWSVRQLEALARAYTLLALMVSPSSADYQDYCLMAYAFLKRIWQVTHEVAPFWVPSSWQEPESLLVALGPHLLTTLPPAKEGPFQWQRPLVSKTQKCPGPSAQKPPVEGAHSLWVWSGQPAHACIFLPLGGPGTAILSCPAAGLPEPSVHPLSPPSLYRPQQGCSWSLWFSRTSCGQ